MLVCLFFFHLFIVLFFIHLLIYLLKKKEEKREREKKKEETLIDNMSQAKHKNMYMYVIYICRYIIWTTYDAQKL